MATRHQAFEKSGDTMGSLGSSEMSDDSSQLRRQDTCRMISQPKQAKLCINMWVWTRFHLRSIPIHMCDPARLREIIPLFSGYVV